jgi:hypothetical protein
MNSVTGESGPVNTDRPKPAVSLFSSKIGKKYTKKKIVDPTGKFLKLYVFNLRCGDRRARVSVNAIHVQKKAVFENPTRIPRVFRNFFVPCLALLGACAYRTRWPHQPVACKHDGACVAQLITWYPGDLKSYSADALLALARLAFL